MKSSAQVLNGFGIHCIWVYTSINWRSSGSEGIFVSLKRFVHFIRITELLLCGYHFVSLLLGHCNRFFVSHKQIVEMMNFFSGHQFRIRKNIVEQHMISVDIESRVF